jgi:hypothetical protein
MESSTLSDSWACLGAALIVVVLIGLAVLASLSEGRRLRRLRAEFLRSHAAIPEEEFLRQAGVPPEGRQIALAVREGVSAHMGVPEATLHPADGLAYLDRFSFDPMGYLEFVEDISWSLKRLGLKTYERFWNPFFLDWRR